MAEARAVDWHWLTDEAIEDFKEWRVARGATRASASSYATGARAFVRYCRNANVEPTTAVDAFRDHLARENRLTPHAQSSYGSHAFEFVEFLRARRP